MNNKYQLADFLADVVMTGYYLAEPPKHQSEHLHDVEAKCLKIIHAFGPLMVHDISDLLQTTKPRATQLVHVLEDKGLIYRETGLDHRVIYINTTKKGAKTVMELRQKYINLAEAIEKKIGSKKTMTLSQILSEISPLTSLDKKRRIRE